jgi:hypothetical protein
MLIIIYLEKENLSWNLFFDSPCSKKEKKYNNQEKKTKEREREREIKAAGIKKTDRITKMKILMCITWYFNLINQAPTNMLL